MEQRYAELKRRLGEISDLHRARSILAWDQQVKMPPRGASVRAEQLATLDRVAHAAFTAPEIGRLLDELEGWAESRPYESDEASLVRVVRRDWEKARRVPTELRAEMTRSAALALPVWVEARRESDFALFLPHLKRNLELRLRYVECFDVDGDPYDVLLDDYERDLKTAEVEPVFAWLKEAQVPLVREAAERGGKPPVGGAFPVERQNEFELSVIRRFGFDERSWRLDPTVHPFASGAGTHDIRLTTRHFEDRLDGLFATMHEFGHGLYEHQVDPALERTPLCRGASLGVHESQSRMWENLVGRSLPFWRFFYPRLRETFPEALGSVELEEWYRHVNAVEPSLIRVEADEATYNLHIVLRFELERALLYGELTPEDLPEAWREKVREYLGLEVPSDREGVLQDVHWAGGNIGYFPTYALGNVVSAQIWERVVADVPDLPEQVEQGEFGALREWLRERLHRHGRKFTPRETLERVVGGPIDPEPYLAYLRSKTQEIYGLAA